MYVHYQQPTPSVHVAREASPARYLVVRHHPLLLARLAWRPALALLLAAGLTLSRAMALSPLSEGVASLLTIVGVGLFIVGGLGGAWTYLNWSSSWLLVGSGRLVMRTGVPGIRRFQRELLLTRVSRVDLRWPVFTPHAWRCADLVIGVTGAGDIRFPLVAEADAARDALLNRSRSGAWRVGGLESASVAPGTAVTVAQEESQAAIGTYSADRSLRASGPGLLDRPGNADQTPRVWRRHVWWPLRRSLWPVGLAAVGCLTPVLAWPTGAVVSAPNARLAGVALTALAAVWLAVVWPLWWHDRLLIHDGRLVYRSGTPWLGGSRDSVVPLAAADDFALRVVSPLGHLFDYGDIAVGMTGAWPFVYRCAGRPEALVRALREASVVAQVERETPAGRLLGSDVVPAPSLARREWARGGRYRRLTWPRSFTHRRAREQA